MSFSSALSNDDFFSRNFLFKGGTCLIKNYLGYFRFSEDLMDVIRAFKEEMEIISDRELMEEIARSEERSKEKKTRVLSARELKGELGL